MAISCSAYSEAPDDILDSMKITDNILDGDLSEFPSLTAEDANPSIGIKLGSRADNKGRGNQISRNYITGFNKLLQDIDHGGITVQRTIDTFVSENIIHDNWGVSICDVGGNKNLMLQGNVITGTPAEEVRFAYQFKNVNSEFSDNTHVQGGMIDGAAWAFRNESTSNDILIDPFIPTYNITTSYFLRPKYYGEDTVNLPSIAAGGNAAATVTVTGARVGDAIVKWVLSVDQGSLLVAARVDTNDRVTFLFHNPTGTAIDLAPGTLKVWVEPKKI